MNSRVWAIAALGASLVLGAPRAALGGEPEPSSEARRHFKAGVALLQDPEGQRFEEAFIEFKTAYDLSHSPKVLGNIGLCAMKLERDGEAIRAYERYLAEVPDIDPEERAQIVHDLETMKTSVVRLTVTARKKGVVLVDTRTPVQGSIVRNEYEVPEDRLEVLIHPGQHQLVIRVEGADKETWQFSAPGGAKVAHHFALRDEPPPAEAASGERSPMAWVVLGLGAAGLAAGAVTGVVALSKVHDLSSSCPNNVCTTSEAKSELHSTKTLVTVTDVLLIGGAVVASAGLVWLLWPSSGRTNEVRVGGACTGVGCFGAAGVTF
jgi:hypothetical protein